jgi:hypothetical protein
MDKKEVEGVSGHSVRVGATQDLLAFNIDLALSDASRQMEIQ